MEAQKFMYEKAIDGYNSHVGRYNTWMNYYALFVGALFVAYYNVIGKGDDVLNIITTLVGLVASICWLGSFYGYYSWLKSWIKVVQHHEKQYLSGCNPPEVPVYTLISKSDLERQGFSTQKITRAFIWVVVVAWFSLLVKELCKPLQMIDVCCELLCVFLPLIIILIVLFVFLVLPKFFLSDVDEKHFTYLENVTQNAEQTKEGGVK